MTIRQVMIDLLIPLFVADSTIVDSLQNSVLEQANAILEVLEDLAAHTENVFAEDGSAYIAQVGLALRELADLGIEVPSILPRSQNLTLALQFVNALTSEQLDRDMPALHESFDLYEAALLDGLYRPTGVPLRSFVYHNPNEILESLHYLDFRNSGTDLSADDFDGSGDLNAIMVSSISRLTRPTFGQSWIMSSSEDAIKRASLARYHALLSGFVLTPPVLSPHYSGVEDIPNALRRTGSYEQFIEPFEMLSEINSRSTVIDAFLSSYHSLENYMVRVRIVEVERAHGAATLFSMRQFRSIYSAVDKSEQDQLKFLFKTCQFLDIGGMPFEAYAVSRVAALIAALGSAGISSPDLATFLSRLGMRQPILPNSPSERFNLISSLIYKVRCSIVHNKETEYHISNRELLDRATYLVLTELCIPVMRRIAFGLPSIAQGNPILYSRKELMLY